MSENAKSYQPPFVATPEIVRLVAELGEVVGGLVAEEGMDLRLRRINRIRTVHGSLAIEGNTLDEEQITALLDGKRVVAPPREIREAQNALAAYDRLDQWHPEREADLLAAHGVMMDGLVDEAGAYRRGNVGVVAGGRVVHMAPPARRVQGLMASLLAWLAAGEHHPLVAGAIFHYEFEFIHPFADGNGRMGRLWQTLILSRWRLAFARLPVESLVYIHQQDYYQAIRESTRRSDAAPFVAFMLAMIREAVDAAAPQVAPQVTPQVAALVKALDGTLSRDALQKALGLADRKSFRERYLAPALAAGLIEMTIPDKPNSRMQQYRRAAFGEAWFRANP